MEKEWRGTHSEPRIVEIGHTEWYERNVVSERNDVKEKKKGIERRTQCQPYDGQGLGIQTNGQAGNLKGLDWRFCLGIRRCRYRGVD